MNNYVNKLDNLDEMDKFPKDTQITKTDSKRNNLKDL